MRRFADGCTLVTNDSVRHCLHKASRDQLCKSPAYGGIMVNTITEA